MYNRCCHSVHILMNHSVMFQRSVIFCPLFTGINQDDQEAMKRRVEAVWRYRDERLQTARDTKNKKSGIADTFLSCGGKRSKQAKKGTTNTLANAPSSRPESSLNPATSAATDRDVLALSERCALIIRDILDAG